MKRGLNIFLVPLIALVAFTRLWAVEGPLASESTIAFSHSASIAPSHHEGVRFFLEEIISEETNEEEFHTEDAFPGSSEYQISLFAIEEPCSPKFTSSHLYREPEDLYMRFGALRI